MRFIFQLSTYAADPLKVNCQFSKHITIKRAHCDAIIMKSFCRFQRILLLSTSEIKKEAVKRVFPGANVITLAVDVHDNPEQPIEPYGLLCAVRRMQAALAGMLTETYDLIISIESSIYLDTSVDMVHIVTRDLYGSFNTYSSDDPTEFRQFEPKFSELAMKMSGQKTSPYGYSSTVGEAMVFTGDADDPKNWCGDRVEQIMAVLRRADVEQYNDPLAEARIRIRYVMDFPKPGVLYQDIAPLFFKSREFHPPLVHRLMRPWMRVVSKSHDYQNCVVVGIESRGFALGALLASESGIWPFIMVRKAGKIPPPTISASYGTEYSQDTLEIAENAPIPPNAHVIIVDDVVATGGSLLAAAKLVQRVQPECSIVCTTLVDVPHLRRDTRRLFQAMGIELHTVLE